MSTPFNPVFPGISYLINFRGFSLKLSDVEITSGTPETSQKSKPTDFFLEKASLHSENFNQMEPVEKHWNDLRRVFLLPLAHWPSERSLIWLVTGSANEKQFENHCSDKMSQRGDYLNAEKEKLQLKHEENEFKEQIKLLRERLEHFDDPTDENSGKFGNFWILKHWIKLKDK